jgi:hypothetical protein
MRCVDPKDAETSGACYGIHLCLSFLLAICLAAYDGLEHTYPILFGYMLIGWVIPVALLPFVKKIVGRPVNPIRSATNTYVAPITLMSLGTLAILLSIFLSPSFMDSITINGQKFTKLNPRFATEVLKFRIELGCMGLLFAVIGFFIFRYICKRKK